MRSNLPKKLVWPDLEDMRRALTDLVQSGKPGLDFIGRVEAGGASALQPKRCADAQSARLDETTRKTRRSQNDDA
jgi:hypothetical protein